MIMIVVMKMMIIEVMRIIKSMNIMNMVMRIKRMWMSSNHVDYVDDGGGDDDSGSNAPDYND